MALPDIGQLFDSKLFVSALSLAAGGLIGNLLTILRNRLRTLEYTVVHDRVGFSADDNVFGAIRVTWQNAELTNLYSSVVTLENPTTKDFTDLRIKTYTGDTLLLSERTEVAGSTYVLKWTPEFQEQLKVEPGAAATPAQFDIYRHQREYVVSVLNRGQRAVMRYLTTVPTGNSGPSVWLDVLHSGVRARYRHLHPHVHGVPVKIAASFGLVLSLATFVLASFYLAEPWAAALICLLTGLFAQSVGAFAYRALRFLSAIVFH